MNANRKFSMVSRGFLAAALFITALIFGFQQAAFGSGEIRGFENRTSPDGSMSASMGNLHRYEKQQEQLASPVVFTGFGDLHKYENQLEALSHAGAVPVGMGDVHRFEAAR